MKQATIVRKGEVKLTAQRLMLHELEILEERQRRAPRELLRLDADESRALLGIMRCYLVASDEEVLDKKDEVDFTRYSEKQLDRILMPEFARRRQG